MTRNVKRFLAASLLSVVPSMAFAAPVEFGFPDLLSARTEYVSLSEEGVRIPVRKGPAVQSIGPALEDLLVINQTGANISLGVQVVSGTINGVYNPYPIPTGNLGGYQVSAIAPAIGAPVVQQYYWTVNPSAPATSKTCVWRLEVSTADGVTCSAQVFFGTYGGASCTLDGANSFIDPNTCYAQIVTQIQ